MSDETHDASSKVDNLTRSADLYYPDGNICIIAQENVVYKVYRGQLAKHSQIFSDMLEVCSESAGAVKDVYDGVPCVRVEESSETWDIILRYLFTPSFSLPNDQPNVFALISVSRKYAMETLLAQNMQRLKMFLPWTMQNAKITLDFYKSNPAKLPEVIHFAEQCGIPELLPLAMYRVIMHPQPCPSNGIIPLAYSYDQLVRILDAGVRIRWIWDSVMDQLRALPGTNRKFRAYDPDETGMLIRASGELSRCDSLPKGCHRYGSLVDDEVIRGGKGDPLELFVQQPTPRAAICKECKKGYHELCNWGTTRIFRVLMSTFAVPRRSDVT